MRCATGAGRHNVAVCCFILLRAGLHCFLHGQEQGRPQPYRRRSSSWAWGGAQRYAAGLFRWAVVVMLT